MTPLIINLYAISSRSDWIILCYLVVRVVSSAGNGDENVVWNGSCFLRNLIMQQTN